MLVAYPDYGVSAADPLSVRKRAAKPGLEGFLFRMALYGDDLRLMLVEVEGGSKQMKTLGSCRAE